MTGSDKTLMGKPMKQPLKLIVAAIWLLPAAGVSLAAEPAAKVLDRRFSKEVQPFLKTYCLDCHGQEKQEGKLNLAGYDSLSAVVKNQQLWELVLERLRGKEMPPEDAPRIPQDAERRAAIDWMEAMRADEAQRNAGDPGPVLARRLSNAELDYTIRDLTGVDIRPTKEFPIDPANEAGFDNSGESLSMSPALVKKYLAAARHVADHLVLKPQGFEFAPHVAVTDTDRDKYCVQRIVGFYKRQKTDIADYLFAAWRFEHRAEGAKTQMAIEDVAKDAGISSKYLETVWKALHDEGLDAGPLGELREGWRKLPADLQKPDEARRECEKLRGQAVKKRKELSPKIDKLQVNGISPGSQPLVLWKNREVAAQRMKYLPGKEDSPDAALRKSLERFCQVFPDAFYIADRPPYFEPNSPPSGRLLTAGFHLMLGYFRDDGPLYERILDEAGRKELDGLWQELHFVTGTPQRQYKDFIFFERAEPPRYMREAPFDFARSEDKDAGNEAKIQRLREEYLKKAKEINASETALAAIETYFTSMNAEIRWVEAARIAAEPSHLEALQKFAERAYRRPLTKEERKDVLAFYRSLREKEGLNHEEAMRDSLGSILMSPNFCFRADLAPEGKGAQPLSDFALASRLSYFLWSSMPDEELLAHAAAGDLHQREVLLAQTRRMLKDRRVRGLAVEFGGNWLDFRRFEEHNSVDRERFASFNNELRQAMFEEPVRFFLDVVQENRSVLDFLCAEHTFVNPVLAKHYGMLEVGGDNNHWVRIDDARKYSRGGLLPMAVFLTKNSPGLRTSPVKRGYWVVRRLLGERIPAPPPTVPELPKDEAQLGELTLAQLLAKHRENKSCAVCHARFDSLGLVFEGFGPIGERRDKDLGGHAVETKAVFPGGSEGSGVAGLRVYLREYRQQDFVDNLCRKLLAYALGRTLMLSDKQTLDNLKKELAADEYRFENIVDSIVTSRQFLNQRGRGSDADQP
jgi:mono/diheme cytochrome c family protein